MEYDIFLGGPWEKYAPFPYKSMIKAAFPDKNIFDPETRPSQTAGDWFSENYFAIEDSLTMVTLVPSFPFPGVGPEVGFFYHEHCCEDPTKRLEELVIIWPVDIKPDFGKKVAAKMGYIVENPEEAIARLRPILYTAPKSI
jgi:hypothetical protein